METYKIHTNSSGDSLVTRTNADGTLSGGFAVEGNPIYQQYLQWLEQGNTPEPAENQ